MPEFSKKGPDKGKKQEGPQALLDALLYVEEMTVGNPRLTSLNLRLTKGLRSKKDGGYGEDLRTIASDILRELVDLI